MHSGRGPASRDAPTAAYNGASATASQPPRAGLDNERADLSNKERDEWMTHRSSRPIHSYSHSAVPSLHSGHSGLHNSEPLAQWMQDRQRAFAEFSSSLRNPSDFFSSQDPFFWQPLPSAPPPPVSLNQEPSSGFYRERESYSPPTSRRAMLSSNEASLSPKAKVTYDEGQFAVEIPLKDYKVNDIRI